MAYRYSNRRVIINNDSSYRKLLKDRGLRLFRHYESPHMKEPSFQEVMELKIIQHVWKHSDRYYKIAHKYYGDSTLWWVVARFNKKPTEGHVKVGDVLDVPFPLEKILAYYEI